ncbi:MAG: SDR family oxidoreductase [Gammaproteobacteria bacterium]
MNLKQARVLLTGGAGGIGGAIAEALLAKGAAVLLVDMNEMALQHFATGQLGQYGDRVATLAANLTRADDRALVSAQAQHFHGGINVLINNAGVSHFRLLDEQSPEAIDLALAVNLQAPIHLCRLLLPHLRGQAAAHILNTGSVFGSIGYPAYAVYSATKFGMRGFSEALRRELGDSTVSVHYLAPRATRTGINSAEVEQMNAELGVTMDTVSTVAAAACRILENEADETVVGWPEKLFTRINSVLPGLVDKSIARQLAVIRRYAGAGPAATPSA